jgi:hypothetical protein
MTKTILRLSAAAALLGALIAPAQAAGGWTFLPGLNDPGFKFAPTLALTANSNKPDRGSSATGYGIDLNFNCALIQSPDQRIRTHLNISHTSKDGQTVNAFELSPRYTIPLGAGLSVGVGPSLALFRADAGSGNKNLFGAGVATGMNYNVGAFYTGFDLRYHSTKAKDGVDYDPTSIGVKVGVNF